VEVPGSSALRATAGEPVPEEFAGLPAFGGLHTVPAHHLLVVGDNPTKTMTPGRTAPAPSRLRGVVAWRLGTGDAGPR